MENKQTIAQKKRKEQNVLCSIVSILESQGIKDNNDIAYYCVQLMNSDRARGVKRSVTVQRKRSLDAIIKMFNGSADSKNKLANLGIGKMPREANKPRRKMKGFN